MRNWLGVFLDIIYPCYCPICRVKIAHNDNLICELCWGTIKTNHSPFCLNCGAPLENLKKSADCCPLCRNQHFKFDRALSVCRYEGIIKVCIHLFKYKRKLRLTEQLVDLMQKFVMQYLDKVQVDLIIPVPLYPVKILERGFNQSEILALNLSRRLDIKCVSRNLWRKKKTISQSSLRREERFVNVSGAFAVRDAAEFRGKSILLIDDIFTTGATLNECARVLKQAGSGKVTALTLAR